MQNATIASLADRSSVRLLAASCFAVCCITLTLGLWPFHSPQNQVSWEKDANGISYGAAGTVLSAGNLSTAVSENGAGKTVEIWAKPYPYLKSATLLTFYRPPAQFRVRQSLTELCLRDDTGSDLCVAEAFRRKRAVFITIAAGLQRTSVYIDGQMARRSALRISGSWFGGRLILGDSALDSDSWRGQVLGLAIYSAELTQAQTLRHYNTWTKNGMPEIALDERNTALYLFDEHNGRIVHNRVKLGIDLYIPQKYQIIDKAFMKPFWREFSMSDSYRMAVIKNIVGFVPLGFCLYPYLLTRQMRRAELIAVVIGMSVSIAIEAIQWLLPTRDSGTTDILTNTLGTFCGARLYRYASSRLLSVFRAFFQVCVGELCT